MDILSHAALNIAKTERRYRAKGDFEAAEKAHARLLKVVEQTQDPIGTWRKLADRVSNGHAVSP